MAIEMTSPLKVKGLCKQYPAFRLEDVSFELVPGSITGFIGRNGAGKTTTINSILAFVKPDAGDISFFGMEYPEHDREIKEKIGFVSAGMTYYTRKKLKTITAVTKTFYPGWDDGAYRKWLNAFSLDEEKTPAELSNGMKIKYALALALSHGADLMLLDEPTSGLDPVSREELIEIFLRLREEGKTILFSTHITSDLDKCADRILFLQKGRLTADRPLDDFIGASRLMACPGAVPQQAAPFILGQCRTREGCTALLRREDAERLNLDCRQPDLEEIMVHLEKEGAQ